MKIQVTIKSVYGTDTIYPANDAARTLAMIAGTKTLTLRTLKQAKQLGHSVEYIERAGLAAAMLAVL